MTRSLRGLPPYAPLLALACAASLALGCAGSRLELNRPPAHPGWAYFGPAPGDVWEDKIVDWQARQRRDAPALAAEPRDAPEVPSERARLRVKSLDFERDQRQALAARIAEYAQTEARRHFRWDPETNLADDPWPTSLELYAQNGDDCDGLDLIAYDLMVAFGFPEEEIYRVVLRRDRDGANHMATLWFEQREDPWVIDATGAITRWLRRLSDLPGWTPLRVFDEDELYGVAVRPPAGDAAAR